DWQGGAPVVRGGTYSGQLWQAPRRAPDPELAPELAVTGATAVLLEPGREASQLRAWNLESGAALYAQTLAGDYPALGCDDNALVLQSEAEVRLLDAATGAQSWRVERHEDALAAVAQTAVIFWEPGGHLIGLARNNGALLWRLRFEVLGERRN
ncbi:MAG: PQQ-binding-like beta-propeller repeat protein, partial [Terriglobales bacterium]